MGNKDAFDHAGQRGIGHQLADHRAEFRVMAPSCRGQSQHTRRFMIVMRSNVITEAAPSIENPATDETASRRGRAATSL